MNRKHSNYKFIATALTACMLAQPLSASANSWQEAAKKIMTQKKILENWQSSTNKLNQSAIDFQVHWNEDKGIPNFIQGFASEEKIKSKTDAKDFIKKNGALFKIDGGDFDIKDSFTDKYGMTHYRIVQEIDGIPIYGKELIVHTDDNDHVYALNGDLQPGIETVRWSHYVELSQEESIVKAKAFLGDDFDEEKLIAEPEVKLFLYEFEGEWYVSHLVTLQFNEPYPANYKIFVDAENGNIVDSYNAVADGHHTCYGTTTTGKSVNLNGYEQKGTFYLYDTTRPAVIETYSLANKLGAALPGTRVTSSSQYFNSSSQSVAVDVHDNLGKVYDYFYNKFGRRSFDDRNSTITGSVHYYDQESGKNNAFWNGRQMLFGDGDGQQFGPFGAALDVVAHEFTHAVTQYTANLEYRNQPGAINESMSDVFGILCEGEEPQWWLMGEDCYTPNRAGDALRDAKNPGAVDQPQPAHMNEYRNVSYDNGGVHINSGIPNKAFYHIASTIGFDDSGKIYYRALTTYLTSQSDFMDLRNAVLQSASDIFGASSSQYQAVQNGFSAVGLGTASTSDTFEPNNTAKEAYGMLEKGKAYDSYISSSTDVDIYKFESPRAGDITVSLDNVPADYDLYLYDGQGQLVERSETDGVKDEQIQYNGAAGLYYVKVVGYNGAYNASSPYRLTVDYPTTDSGSGSGGDTEEDPWSYENLSYDTPHNYSNNYKKTITYTQEGASAVAIHFSRFETEEDYDFVKIYDVNRKLVHTYSGTLDPFWSTVDGEKMYIEFISDAYVNGYGFTLDKGAYIQ